MRLLRTLRARVNGTGGGPAGRRIAALACALLLGAACAGGTDRSGGAPATVPPAATITLSELAFVPASLVLRSGEHTRLVLENRGALLHDFTVDEAQVADVRVEGGSDAAGHAHGGPALHLALAPGASGALAFRPTAPGRFEFYCSVPGHREAGMRGTLTVE